MLRPLPVDSTRLMRARHGNCLKIRGPMRIVVRFWFQRLNGWSEGGPDVIRPGRAATRGEPDSLVITNCYKQGQNLLFLRNPEAVASGPPWTPPVVPRFQSRVGF